MRGADDAVASAQRAFAAETVRLAAHELNNRLAVMRETLGLMEDLARAGKGGAAGTARAHASLDDQVGRALNVVRALSGLGGALGAVGEGFDAAAAVGDLLGLVERWARQRSLRIESELGRGCRAAGGDPALFLCLVHRLLERCAEGLGAGAAVDVRVRRDAGSVRVAVGAAGTRAGGAAAARADDREEELDRELAKRLGGRLCHEEGGVTTIELAAAR